MNSEVETCRYSKSNLYYPRKIIKKNDVLLNMCSIECNMRMLSMCSLKMCLRLLDNMLRVP